MPVELTETLLQRIRDNDPMLTELDLYEQNIADEGAGEIAEALKTNNSLTTIDLRWNKITDAGAKKIAEVLKTNNSLTTIYLGSNQIGAEGVEKIAEVCLIALLCFIFLV